MINLLPQSARKKLLLEYWSRVLIVWFGVWSIAIVLSTILLLPAYARINYQVAAYKESSKSALDSVAGFDAVTKELARASDEARIIVDESYESKFSSYIKLFESSQGANISLTNIQIVRGNDKTADMIVLGGVAADRISLASYRDQLLADDRITAVDLPISDLAKDKNLDFTLTIEASNETLP